MSLWFRVGICRSRLYHQCGGKFVFSFVRRKDLPPTKSRKWNWSNSRTKTLTYCALTSIIPYIYCRSSSEEGGYFTDGPNNYPNEEHKFSGVGNLANGSTMYMAPLVCRLFQRYYEYVAIVFRLVYLLMIFVPVIISIPVVYIEHVFYKCSNDRVGTILCYRFLIYCMELAGPTFIKLGQWAATRTDIFPMELCDMMSRLHSNNKAHSLSHTKQIIEEAFNGRQFNTIFEDFNEQPIGVGAVAQVYKAKLHKTLRPPGRSNYIQDTLNICSQFHNFMKLLVSSIISNTAPPSDYVAIKVLHPQVDRIVYRDLAIMLFFAQLLNWIPNLEWLSLPDEVVKFGEMMRLQLDLRIEAQNLKVLRDNFRHFNTVVFPMPYPEYTSKMVLIEEFAKGLPLHLFLENGAGAFQREISDFGLDAFFKMLLIDNFIHADLHPGNIFVNFRKPSSIMSCLLSIKGDVESTEDISHRLRQSLHSRDWTNELKLLKEHGFKPQLVFIDCGLVTELDANNRSNFLDLFTSLAEFDGYKAGNLMVERCRSPTAVIEKDIFALKMQHLVLNIKSKTFTLGNIKIGDILQQVMAMVRKHHVRLEGDFVNVVIGILLLEGIGRQLDPNIDIFKSTLPILRLLGTQRDSKLITMENTTMLKVWIALEARQFLASSLHEIENLVKYDLLSPNI